MSGILCAKWFCFFGGFLCVRNMSNLNVCIAVTATATNANRTHVCMYKCVYTLVIIIVVNITENKSTHPLVHVYKILVCFVCLLQYLFNWPKI